MSHLHATVAAFNRRNFKEAVRHSSEGLSTARGRDEAFWMGLLDACEGYGLLAAKDFNNAEPKLIDSMHKLRNFGFRLQESFCRLPQFSHLYPQESVSMRILSLSGFKEFLCLFGILFIGER